MVNNWSAAFRRVARAEISEQTVLTVPDAIRLRQVSLFRGDGSREMSEQVLELASGSEMQVDDPLVDMLGFIDGKRTLREVFDELSKAYDTGASDASSLVEVVEPLVREGVLSARPGPV